MRGCVSVHMRAVGGSRSAARASARCAAPIEDNAPRGARPEKFAIDAKVTSSGTAARYSGGIDCLAEHSLRISSSRAVGRLSSARYLPHRLARQRTCVCVRACTYVCMRAVCTLERVYVYVQNGALLRCVTTLLNLARCPFESG